MKNDGGPAFPCMWQNDSDVNLTGPSGRVVPPGADEILQGMSLRDWLAGRALSGVINNCRSDSRGDETLEQYFAIKCYQIADAMLAERSK